MPVIGGRPEPVNDYPSFAFAPSRCHRARPTCRAGHRRYQRASRLVELGNRLGDPGRREEALAAIDEAVTT